MRLTNTRFPKTASLINFVKDICSFLISILDYIQGSFHDTPSHPPPNNENTHNANDYYCSQSILHDSDVQLF